MAKLHKPALLLPIVGAITILLLGGCGQNTQSVRTIPQGGAQSQVSQQVSTSIVVSLTAVPTTPPTANGNPTVLAKLEIEARDHQTQVARAIVISLTPTLPIPTYPTETPTDFPVPTGVVQHPTSNGMHICDCDFESEWTGRLPSGWYITAWAGTLNFGYGNKPQDPSWKYPGLIVIGTNSANLLATTPWEAYFTPIQAGSVHIVSADGMQLTLLSTNGTQFVFDAGTRTWISPPVTPTVVPTAPPTTSPTALSTMLPKVSP